MPTSCRKIESLDFGDKEQSSEFEFKNLNELENPCELTAESVTVVLCFTGIFITWLPGSACDSLTALSAYCDSGFGWQLYII